jgi:DNA polymerase III subunit chi
VTDVGFYHLTRTSVEQALPALLGRTLAAGKRAVVVCPDEERVTALDAALWECAEPDWLPHGTAADGDAELQPIWLATDDAAPNGATFLFLVHGAVSGRLAAFERVFDLFDGKDEAVVAAARERWKRAKEAGHTLTYWRQGARGWEKGA